MGAPKRRTSASKSKTKTKRKPDYVMGPVPTDIFSLSHAEPPGPSARSLTELERLRLLVANPDLYDVAEKVFPARTPGTWGRRPAYPPFILHDLSRRDLHIRHRRDGLCQLPGRVRMEDRPGRCTRVSR